MGYTTEFGKISLVNFLSSPNLMHLTQLSIDGGELPLMVDILQNCSATLEELYFDSSLLNSPQQYQNISNALENKSVKRSLIKVFSLFLMMDRIRLDEYSTTTNPFNELFQFVIKSCPLLEKFKLVGALYPLWKKNSINLSFLNQDHLKDIQVQLAPCKYYSIVNNNSMGSTATVQKWVVFRSDNGDFEIYESDGGEEEEGASLHIILQCSKTPRRLMLGLKRRG